MATLTAAVRDSSKKSVTHALRKGGKIPSVVYGKTVGNQSIAVNAGDVNKLFRDEGKNAIISLNIEGENNYTVMAHELQFNYLKGDIQHIDFLEINLNETLDAVVPVELLNVDQVEAGDTVVNHQLSELTVRALPNNLPSSIEVDVSTLKVGDSIRISDLTANADYTVLGDPEDVIVSLSYGGSTTETEEEETTETTEAAPAAEEKPAE